MFRWIIWALSASFVVLNYVQQIFPDIVAPDLAKDFNASQSTLGSIAAAYFIAYATLQIPVGMALDRFGVRGPLSLAVLLAGLGAIVFSNAQTAEQAFLARLLMGASSAFSFLSCLKLVQGWFPVSKFSTLAGMTNTAAMLGAAGGMPLAFLVGAIGWRESMVWIGAVELVLAVVIFVFIRDTPQVPIESSAEAFEPKNTHHEKITGFLRDPQVWLNALYATSISLIFVAFGGLWGASFIAKSYGVDEIEASNIGSLLFFGGMVGSLFFGWYSDYIQSRKKPMIGAAAGGLVTISLILLVPDLPLLIFEVGLFLIGFFSSANIVSYAVARELYPKISGLSIGFLSTCFFAGSAISQPFLGYLLEQHSQDRSGGLSSLTASDYRFAFCALVVFMAIGLLASILIKDTIRRS